MASEVEEVAYRGEIIADYPDDRPYPSCQLLGFPGGRPLHVVLAIDASARIGYVVTTYEPNPDTWDAAFKNRRGS